MPKGKCHFNARWLDDPEFFWVDRYKPDNSRAYCKCCKKDFDVGISGRCSLLTHAKGAKHLSLVAGATASARISSLWSVGHAVSSPSSTSLCTAAVSEQRPTVSVTSFVSRNDCLRAEVVWTLKSVSCHYSYTSSNGLPDLFRRMFPDSKIAEQFSCSERKVSYLCCFGIAPFVNNLLKSKVRKEVRFVLLFDESMNQTTHSKQLDMHVRFWTECGVVTRYVTSAFLGHATAEDILERFEQCCEGLDLRHLQQLSMDGPNVNWKVFRLLSEKLETECSNTLLDIGSCGLHIVHTAFKDGCSASGWEIHKLPSALHYLFKDTPARREDFREHTGSDVFPLKFCNHRWLENGPVAQRVLKIWDTIKCYVEKVSQKVIPNPGTSYDTVARYAADNLTPVKLTVFGSIANQLQPFLTVYQTDGALYC